MKIRLQGEEHELPDSATVETAIRALGLDPAQKGIAVAVDGDVVRRAEWASRGLCEGARVEVVSARQGG